MNIMLTKQKKIYDRLKKIKKPVFLFVTNIDYVGRERVRILYPDGNCMYHRFEWDSFVPSCFVGRYSISFNLKNTVNKMRKHDKYMDLIVTDIIPI